MRVIIKIHTMRATRRESLVLPKGKRSVGAASLRRAKGTKDTSSTKEGMCERTTESL